VRYWAARARLGVDTAYDEQLFRVGKRLCTKLFNASKFAVGRFGDIDPTLLGPDKVLTEVDRAVVQTLRPLITRATEAFESFDYAQAMQLTEDYFWQTFCDNYLELAKPRTYIEELTDERLSAASTLRIMHRVLVRMLAPFVPYLAEEVWGWCYKSDPDMAKSIHRSPWPSTDELANIPKPLSEHVYPAAVDVIEAVRKAKAEANLSMKAPVERVEANASSEVVAALRHAVDDLSGMLHIEQFELAEGEPGEGLVQCEVVAGAAEKS
jgi:valyl-tRNA synthetase